MAVICGEHTKIMLAVELDNNSVVHELTTKKEVFLRSVLRSSSVGRVFVTIVIWRVISHFHNMSCWRLSSGGCHEYYSTRIKCFRNKGGQNILALFCSSTTF